MGTTQRRMKNFFKSNLNFNLKTFVAETRFKTNSTLTSANYSSKKISRLPFQIVLHEPAHLNNLPSTSIIDKDTNKLLTPAESNLTILTA